MVILVTRKLLRFMKILEINQILLIIFRRTPVNISQSLSIIWFPTHVYFMDKIIKPEKISEIYMAIILNIWGIDDISGYQ